MFKFIYNLFLFVNLANSFTFSDINLSRKDLLKTALISKNYNSNQPLFTLSSTFSNLPDIDKEDKFSHWSFFGLSPPPIEKSISYDELVDQIKKDKIYTIQIAIQHNCVIATTKKGHRLACLIPDSQFSRLIKDSMTPDGKLPVYVLPIDPIRSKVRNIAQIIFYSSLFIVIGSDSGLLPIDLPSYSSIKEREDAKLSGKKPKKWIKSYLLKILSSDQKNKNSLIYNISNVDNQTLTNESN
jgi:hypothetical protein